MSRRDWESKRERGEEPKHRLATCFSNWAMASLCHSTTVSVTAQVPIASGRKDRWLPWHAGLKMLLLRMPQLAVQLIEGEEKRFQCSSERPNGASSSSSTGMSTISCQQTDRLMANHRTSSLATAVWLCRGLCSSPALQQRHQMGTGTQPNTPFCYFGALNESAGLLMTPSLSKIRI